jgi:hypothetical protein
MQIYVLLYLSIIFLSIFDFTDRKNKIIFVYLIGIFFIFFVGFRGETGTDSPNYIRFFNDYTDSIWDWQNVEKKYTEYGFYYLSVLLKSIYNNITFYFLCISCISMLPLLKSLSSLSVYPILGFIVYFARFLPARNMNQIRGALAIAIVMYALKFLAANKPKKYIIIVLFATTIHLSILIALIFVFIYKIKVSLIKAVLLLLLSALIGIITGIFSSKLLSLITNNSNLSLLGIGYLTYENLGITNPVIYYQALLCLSFFRFEKRLAKIQRGYYIIRNAYLFSTMILLLTCNLGVIGGRLATLFATCEIFVVPALVSVIRPRFVGYILMTLLISIIFYLNFDKMVEVSSQWIYTINL